MGSRQVLRGHFYMDLIHVRYNTDLKIVARSSTRSNARTGHGSGTSI